MSSTRIVYASFDRFPSPKGAATHIEAFVAALGRAFGDVDLVTIPSEAAERRGDFTSALPTVMSAPTPSDGHFADAASPQQVENEIARPVWSAAGVEHHPILSPGANFFDRVLSFRSQFMHWWRRRFFETGVVVPIVHFRSIFEGYPIARQKDRFCRRLVFEVNGLPSIELKYRYPRVADDEELLEKIRRQEQTCLDAADLILTVSQVNAEHLQRRGVAADRICVIPNGVDVNQFSYQPPALAKTVDIAADRPLQILYSGTMTPWQGVTVAIETLALFRRDLPARLTLVGHALARQKKSLLNRAWELGVHDHVNLLEPVSKPELAKLHHEADAVIAPLIRNDRNLVQGCCPLKVLEAMSSGSPVIASDMPVVRELTTDNQESLLVRPGSAKSLKDGLFRLLDEEGLAERLSAAARRRAEREFTWARAQTSLVHAYGQLDDSK
jgi:glycosyltransferase involved in cell wall biosynthesis